MRDFEYFEPTSISEALSLLARYKDEAKVIAGGTDLLVDMKEDCLRPRYLINLKKIPGLAYIIYNDGNGLKIGSLTTIRVLERSAELHRFYPIISEAAHLIGNTAIRNVATLGGNLCNAAPSADMAPGLIALSATATIVGSEGEKEVPLENFFAGSGSTVLTHSEILTEIKVPAPPPDTRGAYIKYGIRGTSDLPIVNVAVIVTLEPENKVCRDAKIVLGNVAQTPMRASKAEEIIRGKRIDADLIEQCAQVAHDEAHPRPHSIRASGEYKKAMIRVFIRKAIMQAVSCPDKA